MQSYNTSFYNSPQKQAYINFEKTNENHLKRYFVRIAPKEKEYQKDLADMNRSELTDTLTSLNIRREVSRGHMISLLRGYVNWAQLYNKTENENIIETVTSESISSSEVIRQQMLKSPGQLQKIMDSSFNYIDYPNRSKRDSLIVWLLYFGMDINEIQVLKKSDLNYTTNIVTAAKEKQYKINDEIATMWKDCSLMKNVEKRNNIAPGVHVTGVNEYLWIKLVQNEYLFRPSERNKQENDIIPISTLRNTVWSLFTAGEVKVSILNIKNSGTFYRLYTLEKSGTRITPQIIAEYFHIHTESKAKFVYDTRKWNIDYTDWKVAFGYM